jgi:hypothetical protein
MRVLGPRRPGPKKRIPVVPLHVLLSVWARQAPATFMIRPYHHFVAPGLTVTENAHQATTSWQVSSSEVFCFGWGPQ